jgi:hypothetical protein
MKDPRLATIAALADRALVDKLLADDELTDQEREAFQRWRDQGWDLRLTRQQRTWAEEVALRLMPIPADVVPRGREVETPEVLRNLPKRPPPRRVE